MKFHIAALSLLLLGAGTACNRHEQWTLKGHIDNALPQTVILQTSANGHWYDIDSTTVSSSGDFTFKQPAPQYPTVYRITVDNRSAYFPIDSVETVTLSGTAPDFDRNYSLDGTTQARAMAQANSLLARAAANDSVKHLLAELILQDPAGNTAYYIINSANTGSRRVFNPAVPADLRVIGAVANAFSEQRPDDPRTHNLRQTYLTNKARRMQAAGQLPTDTIVAAEVGYPEIELPDADGQTALLSALVEQGPVLVSFTNYQADYSPALNLALSEALNTYAPKHLQVYQVGFDADEFQWRQAARNLPWTTVYNLPSQGARYLAAYNIGSLPALFLINANGELVARIDDPATLASALSANLR